MFLTTLNEGIRSVALSRPDDRQLEPLIKMLGSTSTLSHRAG